MFLGALEDAGVQLVVGAGPATDDHLALLGEHEGARLGVVRRGHRLRVECPVSHFHHEVVVLFHDFPLFVAACRAERQGVVLDEEIHGEARAFHLAVAEVDHVFQHARQVAAAAESLDADVAVFLVHRVDEGGCSPLHADDHLSLALVGNLVLAEAVAHVPKKRWLCFCHNF